MGSILTRSVLIIYISGKVLNLVHLNDTTKFLVVSENGATVSVKISQKKLKTHPPWKAKSTKNKGKFFLLTWASSTTKY